MRTSRPANLLDHLLPATGGSDESLHGPRAREAILLLIALITGVNAFAGDRAPSWYPYVIGTFVAVGAIVLIESFLWPRFATTGRQLLRRRRLAVAARELSPGLHHLVRQSAGLVNPESSNAISRYAWDLAARDPGWRAKLPGLVPPWYFAEFFSLFQRHVDRWTGSYQGLTILAHDFYSMINQYQQVYVRPTFEVMRRFDESQLPPDVRRKVNLLREDYATFVREYLARRECSM